MPFTDAFRVPCKELTNTITAAIKNEEIAIPIPVRIYFPLDARKLVRPTVLSVVANVIHLPTVPWRLEQHRG